MLTMKPLDREEREEKYNNPKLVNNKMKRHTQTSK